MSVKRIIPCMDIQNGKTVKGINFVNIKDIGDPVELAANYAAMGADELVFLDITATEEKRKTLSTLIPKIAQYIKIPFCIGGGIASVEDAAYILSHGAHKISISTATVHNPQLIKELSAQFGKERIVVAIDTKRIDGTWYVMTNGGKLATDKQTVDWAKEVEALGAGEILLTSMEQDGTKDGFAIDITRAVAEAVQIPVIASGGAGTMAHFAEVLTTGKADAALAASIFHYQEISIPELKAYLKKEGVNVR